jgi:endonuclease/exonuclease/phosphatase family metal-dependent hydrolase
LYREWLDLVLETAALSKVREQLQAASAEKDNVVLAGDMNLDTARRLDVRYRRRCLMLAHDTAVAESNMRYLETGITYRSHGRHVREDGKAREQESILDHMCVSKDLVATVNVINNNTTDYYPLLASVMIDILPPSNKSITRRNFKKGLSPALNRALETWPW